MRHTSYLERSCLSGTSALRGGHVKAFRPSLPPGNEDWDYPHCADDETEAGCGLLARVTPAVQTQPGSEAVAVSSLSACRPCASSEVLSPALQHHPGLPGGSRTAPARPGVCAPLGSTRVSLLAWSICHLTRTPCSPALLSERLASRLPLRTVTPGGQGPRPGQPHSRLSVSPVDP